MPSLQGRSRIGGGIQDLQERICRALQPTFQIERQLGLGGMGVVFEAHEPALKRQVAIKVLRPELATAVAAARFVNEARNQARVVHASVLRIYQVGETHGLYWFAMDYVAGETLASRLRQGPLPRAVVLAMARDLLSALGAAHEQGIIHRDVKPANIFLDRGRALLADFGIARSKTSEPGEALTRTGEMIGTLAYMAPEQATGSDPISPATDLYSLSTVLYEALTGRSWPLFREPSAGDWSVVPRGWIAPLQRGLAPSPADRWPTAAEFAAGLTLPRSRWPWVTAALILLAVAIGLVRRTGDHWPPEGSPGAKVLPATSAGRREWQRAESLYYHGNWREAGLTYQRTQQLDSACLACDLRLLELDRWLERRPDTVRQHRLADGTTRFDGSWQDLVGAILGPLETRLDRFRAVVDNDRDFWMGWFYLGEELFNRGPLYGRNRREAIEALDLVSQRQPEFAPLWYDLSLARIANGDSVAAYAGLTHLMAQPPAQGLAQAQRFLAGLAFAYRFTDQGTLQWRALRGEPSLRGLPEVAAGPRLLLGLGSPQGAVELGSMFESEEKDGRLQRSGLIAQMFGYTALGRPEQAHRAGIRLRAAFPGMMAESFSRTLAAMTLLFDEGAAGPDLAASLAGLEPLLTDSPALAGAEARWFMTLGALRLGHRADATRHAAILAAAGSPGMVTLVRAALLADAGKADAALVLSNPTMMDLAGWDRNEQSPFLRAAFKLSRAKWQAGLGRTEGVRAGLLWHQHFHMSDYPVNDPSVAEGDWTFGTLASWQLARTLDNGSHEADVCDSYRMVADRWNEGEPRYRARADTAASRLVALGCTR